MSDRSKPSEKSGNSSDLSRLRSSRQRYKGFVKDYKERRLDDSGKTAEESSSDSPRADREKRRQYLRDYMRWLWPHRYGAGILFIVALLAAGLQMTEPLFMRFIVDKVLLNTGLDAASRMNRLHLAGGIFLGAIILTAGVGVI